MKALSASRVAGLLILTTLVAAFVVYMVVNVPIHFRGLPGNLRFAHLFALIDAIAIVAVVDAVTIRATVRRRKKEGGR